MTPTVPEGERERIIEMATKVRDEQFESCGRGTMGECDLAAHVLSGKLRRMGIPHGVAYGQWNGPIDWENDFHELNGEEAEPDRGHMFIIFPQWGNAVLDITADQFTEDAPEVWFPANPKWYVDYAYDEVKPYKTSKFRQPNVRAYGRMV